MKQFKVFFLVRDTSPAAQGKHPSETETMYTYDVEAEQGAEAVARARAAFDLEHGAEDIHVEGVSVLDA